MRRRNQRVRTDDYQTMGKRVLCGRFAQCLKNNFAVGDEENNLILYNVLAPKPVSVLATPNNNPSALTALTFTRNDDQVIVGSSRGSINLWDLSTLKIATTLKGHTIEVSALACDPSADSLLVSASADTSVKLWDMRTKNAVSQLKPHKKRVNALALAPARTLLSAGDDCLLHALDLKMLRPLYLAEAEGGILCLDASQRLVAAGCVDRLARLYGEAGKLVGSTRSETMPVNCVRFHEEEFLVTAGTDNLKVWEVRGEPLLTDNVESGSKGLLDMVVSDRIQQVAFSGGTLSYHQCFLTDVSFKGPYSFNHSLSYERQERTERTDEAIDRNNSIRRGNSTNPIAHITSEKTKALLASRNDVFSRNDVLSKQASEIAENVNDALSNIKRASQQFGKRRSEGVQLREMMGEEHSKFLKIMSQRAKAIQAMLDLWMKSNFKVLIHTLKTADLYVVSDVLAQILRPSRATISAEFACVIAERAKEMISSKHLSLIKAGLEYMLQVVSLFKDEMIRLKTFGADKGVDLAREERLRRFDQLIEQYVEVFQSHRLKRLAEKNDDTSRLAEQLANELAAIFKKVFGSDYEA